MYVLHVLMVYRLYIVWVRVSVEKHEDSLLTMFNVIWEWMLMECGNINSDETFCAQSQIMVEKLFSTIIWLCAQNVSSESSG